MLIGKKMRALLIFAFIGINLYAQENGFTYKPLFGGGGGIDLFYHRNGSIYFEAGYLQHYVKNELVGGVSISIGTRGYINKRGNVYGI